MGGRAVRVTPDTNILIRAVTKDDAEQGEAAEAALRNADLIAITLPALCEFVWVLQRGRKASRAWVSEAIRQLTKSARVEANRPAIDAGLAILEAGGDFADAVIAFEGRQVGGDIFLTFDTKAAELMVASGEPVELLQVKR
jgi:predicted nucleic-acid-binding protein